MPEAQLDRFLFRVFVGYPTPEELGQILRQTTVADTPSIQHVLASDKARDWVLRARRLVREVLVARTIEEYVVRLVSATHPKEDSEEGPASRWIRYGASPRGAQAILMGAKVLALVRGRVNISFEDVDHITPFALNHRLVLSFEAEAERRTAVDVLQEVLEPIHASSATPR